ncbi:MAG: hypothetical protein AAGF96_05890 [Bacteroidota bacterium]
MAVLLITANEITKKTPIGANVDVDQYAAIIEECQDFVIEKILGTKLIERIKTDYQSSALNGHYLTIRDDYIAPILAYTVAKEFLLIQNFHSRNGGLFKHVPQNAEPVSLKEADLLSNKQGAKADVYIQRLQDFLIDKDSEIPEYTTAQDEDYDIKPDKRLSTYNGLYLGGRYYGHTSAEKALIEDIRYDEGK